MKTMNHVKKRIIISMCAMLLLIITLFGITYAYFVTKIKENKEEKSINVTTAFLELTYDDGNGSLIVDNIKPGVEIETKTFSVKNTGTKDIDSYDVFLDVISNELENYGDLTYILTCESDVDTCKGIKSTFPKEDSVLITNAIKVNETQSYELTLIYKETYTDQSKDMNKKIEGKIEIVDDDEVSAN